MWILAFIVRDYVLIRFIYALKWCCIEMALSSLTVFVCDTNGVFFPIGVAVSAPGHRQTLITSLGSRLLRQPLLGISSSSNSENTREGLFFHLCWNFQNWSLIEVCEQQGRHLVLQGEGCRPSHLRYQSKNFELLPTHGAIRAHRLYPRLPQVPSWNG